MASSGVKIIKTLRKYINGLPTDDIKENVITDPDYVPNHASSDDCPTGCDAVLSGNYLINAESTGSSVYGTTTTTTSTTTTTTTQAPTPVKEYLIANLSDTTPVTIEYKDEYGGNQEVVLEVGQNDTVVSQTEPFRVAGTAEYSVVAQSPFYTPTLTTTTTTLRQSTDYTIDNSSGTESVIVSLTQMGQSEAVETEIKPGAVVEVTSDTEVTAVSGSPTITPSPSLVEPQVDTYTVTNNDYYASTTVQYRPYLSVTDEVILSPRETRQIESQVVPQAVSGATNVTITPANNPTQPSEPVRVFNRLCDQRVIYNDSLYVATFEYTDCDSVEQRIELEPRQSATVSAISQPQIVENPSIGNNYAIETIERLYGSAGSANTVQATTTSTTTTTTTTTTEAPNTRQSVFPKIVKDGDCGKHYYFNEPTQNTDSQPRWYPKTFRIDIDSKTGSFDFISYDPGYIPVLYKVYDGQNLILDKCIVSDENGNKWRSRAYTAFVDAGMSTSDANTYTQGSKAVTPDKLTGRRDYNPFNRKEETTFTLSKVTRNDHILIQVFEPLHNGLDYAAGVSHGAKFEVGCVK